MLGGIFLTVLMGANLLGVRNTVFYGIIGIGGVWLAFLLSGVHATIAAVLAAFTIPASTAISDNVFRQQIEKLYARYKSAQLNETQLVGEEQFKVLQKIQYVSKEAVPPLQRLEHLMHPLVAFIILPIFAFANAGVTCTPEVFSEKLSPVAMGTSLGLLIGKVAGIFGVAFVLVKLKWVKLADGINLRHILGVAFLGAIGFTMSLFIAELAYKDPIAIAQAKIGILFASVVASFIGYFIIRRETFRK
jgi:NhaA family Na+:H+ antiporter